MLSRIIFALAIVIVSHPFAAAQEKSEVKEQPRPLRALLICGGCCHDYTEQHKILSDGIQARANVQVDVCGPTINQPIRP